MNTFHNFSPCIYTAQGKVVCQKQDNQTKLPFLLESFVNTKPNQNSGDCEKLNKRLSDVVGNYNCNTVIDKNPPECSFQFKCKETIQ